MNDLETRQRLVQLRSPGWSLTQIAVELNMSQPTLITWSHKFQYAPYL